MAETTPKTFPLNTGFPIPAVGLGTWQATPASVAGPVTHALRAGYRHIDTAFAYGNESGVGEGIRQSGVPRGDIFLTTKLDNSWHKRAAEGLDASLRALGVEYVDLFLMHWPASLDPEDKERGAYKDWDFVDTWRAMQELVGTGKVRSIGVSNFGVRNLERLLGDASCKIVPAVNQIELHPWNPSPKLVAYCADKGIHVSGYSPLGSGRVPVGDDETLAAIAAAKGRSIQQVLLQWGVRKGWSVLPKSVNSERIEANFALGDWDLTDEEVARIDAIKGRAKVCGDSWLPVKVFYGDDE